MSVVLLQCFLCVYCLAGPDSLTCPEDTRIVETNLDDEFLYLQACVNDNEKMHGPARYFRADDRSTLREETYRNGVLEGEARWFDPDGQLMAEGMYKSGHRLRAHFTLDALRKIASERNALAREKNWNWRLSVSDKQTLHYRVSVKSPWTWFPWALAATFNRLEVDRAMCEIFEMEFSEVEVLLVSYMDDKERILGGETITTRECRKVGNSPVAGND